MTGGCRTSTATAGLWLCQSLLADFTDHIRVGAIGLAAQLPNWRPAQVDVRGLWAWASYFDTDAAASTTNAGDIRCAVQCDRASSAQAQLLQPGYGYSPPCTFPSQSFPGHDYWNVKIASVVTLGLELRIGWVSSVTFSSHHQGTLQNGKRATTTAAANAGDSDCQLPGCATTSSAGSLMSYWEKRCTGWARNGRRLIISD